MATLQIPVEQHIVLDDISWDTYESLLNDMDGRKLRMTYDRGTLEIMTRSYGHESFAELFGYLILFLALELKLPLQSGGTTTFKKKAKRRGLEPDKCYWVRNEKRMRGKKEYDPDRDPPPDLAVEVDVTSSSMDRMGIYAVLRVPEVWRFDGATLVFYRLSAEGKYRVSKTSGVFAGLTASALLRFVHRSKEQEHTALLQEFRQWIRENLLQRGNGKR